MRNGNPGTTASLVKALQRIRQEAVALAGLAQTAIERHSFDPYRLFRSKIGEHEALASVIRARFGNKRERETFAAAVTTEERLRLELLVQASLRFFYALSATTILPIGARETFIDELHSLDMVREKLSSEEHAKALTPGVIDDLDTAHMILEEIAEKAPQLLDFGKARATA